MIRRAPWRHNCQTLVSTDNYVLSYADDERSSRSRARARSARTARGWRTYGTKVWMSPGVLPEGFVMVWKDRFKIMDAARVVKREMDRASR